jgi:hypothetical protein
VGGGFVDGELFALCGEGGDLLTLTALYHGRSYEPIL